MSNAVEMNILDKTAAPGELSPALFRDIAEQWPGAVLLINREGAVRWINEAAREWLRADTREAVGAPLASFVLPWLADPGDLRAVFAGGSRQYPARIGIDARGRERFCAARLVPLRRGAGVFGAMLFIDDVAGAEGSTVVQAEALAESDRAAALGAAQVAAWHRNVQSGEGTIDPVWCGLQHVDPCAGPDHPARWEKSIHPDDVVEYRSRMRELAQGTRTSLEIEYRILTADSRWLWLLQRGAITVNDESGRPLLAAGICIDIDARKRAEVALEEKESRLATALWGARAAFWQWNITTDTSIRSPMWFAMTGYTREIWEGESRPWHSRLHPDDVERVDQAIDDHLAGRTQSIEIEYRTRTAAGEYKWIQDRGRVNEWDFEGNATAAIGVSIDIDNQKRAERRLRSSETRLETVLWGGDIGLWEVDFKSGSTHWHNDWPVRMTISPADSADRVSSWNAAIHPDDLAEAQERFAAHVGGKSEHYDAEYRIRTQSGESRWLFERGRVVERLPDGTAVRMVGVCMDIDERRVAEREAREVQHRLEAAIGEARLCVWYWDLTRERLYCNDLYRQLVGAEKLPETQADHRANWLDRMHEDDVAKVLATEERMLRGDTDEFESEYRLRNSDDTWRWLLERGRVTRRNTAGRPTEIAGFMMDISKQVQVQEELRESEERYRLVSELTPGYIFAYKLDSDEAPSLTYASEGFTRIFGFPFSELAQRGGVDGRIEPDSVEALHAYRADMRRGEVASLEIHIRDFAGQKKWLQVHARPVRDERTGRVIGGMGSARDVTERRLAADRSRATESTLRTQARILETMREGVVLIDGRNRIRLTNPAFDEMFQLPAGEAIDRPIDPLLRGFNEAPARTHFDAAVPVEFDGARTDGSRFVAACMLTRITIGDAQLSLAVVNDVTERKQLEREILEIATREQQRMGGDLHDGLGQDLTGIALMLRGVAGQLRKERSDSRTDVEEIIGLVNAAIESTRVLARGLSPVSSERGGLIAALQSLASRFQDRHGIKVELTTRLDKRLALDDAALNHLYRIAQEAVLNAIRHGAPSRVSIDLSQQNERIHLRIADDGQGFGSAARSASGLGMKIMRYRAQMLGGELTVTQDANTGVTVECRCPVTAEEC